MLLRRGRVGARAALAAGADDRGPRWRDGTRALRLRRLVGALLLAAAAGTAVETLLPEDAAAGPSVLAAATDLPAGHVVAVGDLRPVAVPDAVVPAGALRPSDVGGATGRRVAAAVRAGEVLTDARLAGPGLLAGQPAGTVALAVPVLPASAELVSPGDEVAVLAGATDPLTGALVPSQEVAGDAVDGLPRATTTSAPRAVVLDVPTTVTGSALGGVGATVDDGAVVLAVEATAAPQLAQAAAGGVPVVLAVLP